MERQWGSLMRAARARGSSPADEAAESGARYGLFMTLRDGLGTLIERLVTRLPAGALRLNTPAEQIVRGSSSAFLVHVRGGDPIACDGVIVTTPAPHAARLLRDLDAETADELGHIRYAGTSIVTLAYRREQIGRELDGFGFVVPASEGRRILAGSFSSVKFAGRAPEDDVLLRVFIGGACQSELNELPDAQLREIVTAELSELLEARGEPLFAEVVRWPNAMPQYHLGHVERVATIERGVQRVSGLELAGNAYHGVGIPHCIHSGETAAERLLATLRCVDD
jgi:oxygen-dependent protoporphyrinogen oxidase